jgi:hypothetical protein
VKIQTLRLGGGLIQAEHREAVPYCFKCLKRGGSDTLGGRVRGDECGILLFQMRELIEETVVFGIRYLGVI